MDVPGLGNNQYKYPNFLDTFKSVLLSPVLTGGEHHQQNAMFWIEEITAVLIMGVSLYLLVKIEQVNFFIFASMLINLFFLFIGMIVCRKSWLVD